MDTAEEIYAAFKADGQARCAPKYFDTYYNSWSWCHRDPHYAEQREFVRALFLADKEAKKLAEFKHRHPDKPNHKPAWNRASLILNPTKPIDTGYYAANPIRAYQAAKGLSRQQLADVVGVRKQTLTQWLMPTGYGMPAHGIDILSNKLNVDFEQAYHEWSDDNPYEFKQPEKRRQALKDKYRRIGHALIEVETLQRQLRNEQRRAKADLQRRLNRPGTPLDEMGMLVASVDRLHNREVSAEARRVRLLEEQARTKRAIDAMKRDEDIAAEWKEKHTEELEDFKPDWKLYFGMAIVTRDEKDNWADGRAITDDVASMRVVDGTGHLMLEDMIVEKIDKEREGYFAEMGYNGRSYSLEVLNPEYVPPFADVGPRPLDDLRSSMRDKFSMSIRAARRGKDSVGGGGLSRGLRQDDVSLAALWEKGEHDLLVRAEDNRHKREAREHEMVVIRGTESARVAAPESVEQYIAPPIEAPEAPNEPWVREPVIPAGPIVDVRTKNARKAERKSTRIWHQRPKRLPKASQR